MHVASLKFRGGGKPCTFTSISVDFLLCKDNAALQNSTGIQQTLKTGLQDFIFSQCGLQHGHLVKTESYNLPVQS